MFGKVIIYLFLFSLTLACTSSKKATKPVLIITNDSDDIKGKEDKLDKTSITDNPNYQAGLELIAKNDCLVCHKVDEKIVGPAYREVANKYASQAPGIIPQLANKILKGGYGVWGQVPMLPHPTVSQADAETMVKYILLLKNN